MRILLLSTYELGHQPLHLASAAAALREAGHEVRCLDLSVERWDAAAVDEADAVAFSVPMHTAARLARAGAEAVRRRRPDLPVCLFGLYAAVDPDAPVDRRIAGEFEEELVRWAEGLGGGTSVDLGRHRHRLPVRDGLPSLERYAHLSVGDDHRLTGYVEASRGCAHRCRHCPVPVVYDGRTRKVPVEVVMEDVARLVDAGARHITFGDPDFLNRANHALAVTEGFAERFAGVTYDVTAKVEHLLRYHMMLPRLAATGCLFVVSAFESVNDDILRLLDKGHTAEEAARAVGLLRKHGIEPRPSWLPFTPWTSVSDVLDILDFVRRHDLVGNVDPVQYSIRLLIPRGSLLLELPEIAPYLGPYDPERLTYRWRAADPRTEPLQRELAALVEERQSDPVAEVFGAVWEAVARTAGLAPGEPIAVGSVEGRPRLTEPWFC